MNDLEVKWGTVTDKIKESVKKSPTKTVESKVIESITIDTETEKSLKGLKVIKIDNLYEQEKYEIAMKLMEKCNLEQLQEMNDIYLTNGKYEGKLLETTYRKLVNKFRIKG